MDHQLNRFKETPLPPHLRDLGIAQLAETHGRERRYKYFTHRNHQAVLEREKLAAVYDDDHFAQVGGFMVVTFDEFYKDKAELDHFVDNFKSNDPTSAAKGSTKPRGRPRKTPQQPRGQKRKRVEEPPQVLDDDDPFVVGEASTSTAPPPAKRRRGRPPKGKPTETPASPDSLPNDATPVEIDDTPSVSVPRKRGRPPKNKPVEETPTVAKKRGRPPKNTPRSNEVDNQSVPATPASRVEEVVDGSANVHVDVQDVVDQHSAETSSPVRRSTRKRQQPARADSVLESARSTQRGEAQESGVTASEGRQMAAVPSTPAASLPEKSLNPATSFTTDIDMTTATDLVLLETPVDIEHRASIVSPRSWRIGNVFSSQIHGLPGYAAYVDSWSFKPEQATSIRDPYARTCFQTI